MACRPTAPAWLKRLPTATGLALVGLAVLPDLMHTLPVATWALFNGLLADFMTYARFDGVAWNRP